MTQHKTWHSVKKKKTPGIYFRHSSKLKTFEYAYKEMNKIIKLKTIGEDKEVEAFDELREIRKEEHNEKYLTEEEKDKKKRSEELAQIKKNITFKEIGDQLVRDKRVKKKIKTWYATESIINNHLNRYHLKKINDITTNWIESVDIEIREIQQADSSINKILTIFREIINIAKTKKYLNEDVEYDIKISKVEDNEKNIFISDEIINKLLKELKERSPQTYAITLIATRTGLRNSDIINFRVRDLRESENKIWCKGTKRGRKRFVYLDDETIEEIKKYCKDKEREELIFTNEDGSSRNGVNSTFGRILDNLYNIKKDGTLKPREDRADFHSLRHTFANKALRSGMNIKDLQIQLGHKDIKMTLRYIIDDEEKRFDDVKRMFNTL